MASLEHVHNEIRGLLRAKGLRATTPRIAVLTACMTSCADDTRTNYGHAQSAHSIRPQCGDCFQIVTVSIVRRMDLGDGIWRYEHSILARSPRAPTFPV